jgi:cytochrome oxidase Cu insertion factor (SCO1/SenC/PrrC family)
LQPSQSARFPATAEDGLQRYGAVPDFTLTERSGNPLSLKELRGKIWIADFIYTNCTDTCPLQTAMLAKLQQEYAAFRDLRLVSFSVDPERDSAPVLALYAEKHGADADRWYFLTGPRERLLDLIQKGFHLAVATAPLRTEPDGMIAHSPRFVLVDKQSQIRGYYDSREPEALARLKNHIDILLKDRRDG